MATRNRAILYLRTSTSDQQTVNQRPELEQLARARGYEIVKVVEEQISAAKTRPGFEGLMRDARSGAFDILLVWALDRIGRSMVGNLQAVHELDRCGVRIISARESWLDTSGPTRSLLLAITGWVAEQDRLRVRERTIAGLETARRKGVRLGRPRAHFDIGYVRQLKRDGMTMAAIARKLGVSQATLFRALAA